MKEVGNVILDYFNEIPLYRHRKKAADLKALVEKLTEEITVIKAKNEADMENKPGRKKLAELEEKLAKAINNLEEAEKKVAEQDAKKAAKQAKKAKAK